MSRLLFLVRHAKSSWDDPDLLDHDRPLARRGEKACERLAVHLREQRIAPELVLCSSSTRTRQTLDRIASGFGETPEIRIEDELYGASASALLERVASVPGATSSVMVVAHNPGLEELALSLARPGALRDELKVKFPTGALAALAFETGWNALGPEGAELTAFVTPRRLG